MACRDYFRCYEIALLRVYMENFCENKYEMEGKKLRFLVKVVTQYGSERIGNFLRAKMKRGQLFEKN